MTWLSCYFLLDQSQLEFCNINYYDLITLCMPQDQTSQGRESAWIGFCAGPPQFAGQPPDRLLLTWVYTITMTKKVENTSYETWSCLRLCSLEADAEDLCENDLSGNVLLGEK